MRILRRELPGRKIAEHAQAVAEVHHKHTLAGKALAAVIGVPGLAGLQGAAVDEHQHRQLLPGVRGPPEVEIEGVLAHGVAEVVAQAHGVIVKAHDLGQGVIDLGIARLHGHGRKLHAGAHTAPGLGILRRAPAQLAHRGLGIGDAGEDLHRAVLGFHALDLAVGERHDLGHAAALFHRRAALIGSAHAPHDLAQQGSHRQQRDDAQVKMPAAQKAPVQEGIERQQRDARAPGREGILVELQKRQRHEGHEREHDPEEQIVRFGFACVFHIIPPCLLIR